MQIHGTRCKVDANDWSDLLIQAIRFNGIFREQGELEIGSILAAHPLMDGVFSRKLILLFNYDPSRGASGLVINGPDIAVLSVEDLLGATEKITGREPEFLNLYYGGPVFSRREKLGAGRVVSEPLTGVQSEPSRLEWSAVGQVTDVDFSSSSIRFASMIMVFAQINVKVLHTHGDLPGAHQICPGLYLNFKREDALDKYMAGELRTNEMMVIEGYSGWGPNQLEGELLQHSWFSSKVSDTLSLIRSRLRASQPPGDPEMQKGSESSDTACDRCAPKIAEFKSEHFCV